jgi:nucleotide-binding universal stress UspA family protein
MTSRVLVATDGSPRSGKAIAVAVGLARALNATLVGCTATPPFPYYGLGEMPLDGEAEYLTRVGAAAIDCLDVVERAARDAQVPYVAVIKSQEQPHEAILQAARENDCDLIVMGSRGHGEVASLLVGSETQKVLALADRPVLVVR